MEGQGFRIVGFRDHGFWVEVEGLGFECFWV